MDGTREQADDPMADRVAHFMFEQTQRALERQATILAEFRQRTSMILSATGIVASLLGATALRDGHPRGLMYAALAATALGIGLCLAALRSVNDTPGDPRREWKVMLSAEELEDLRPGGSDLRELVEALRPWRASNARTINRRGRLFWWASAACRCN
jgi:hypothetical protein